MIFVCTHMEAAFLIIRRLNRMTRHSLVVHGRVLLPSEIPLEYTDVAVVVLGGPPPFFIERLSAIE